jgi:hypothetical protein
VAVVASVGVPPAARARTYVPDGSGHIRFKPHSFVGGSGVACGVFTAQKLRWTHYGTRRARATGRVVVNTGEGGCAAGVTRTFHATFRLHRPRRHCQIASAGGGQGIPQRLFTRVDVIIAASEWRDAGGENPWRTVTDASRC